MIPRIPQPIANAIIIGLSVLFAINYLATFVIPGWRPDPAIYGAFMGIVGGSFMLSTVGGKKGPKHAAQSPPPPGPDNSDAEPRGGGGVSTTSFHAIYGGWAGSPLKPCWGAP